MQKATSKVPGKIILTGEHSVLQGCHALASACSVFINCTATKLNTPICYLFSEDYFIDNFYTQKAVDENFLALNNRFSEFKSGLLNIKDVVTTPVELLLYAVKLFFKECGYSFGVEIKINTQLPANSGMGSSAAVIIAIFEALELLVDFKIEKSRLLKMAVDCENLIHGQSSGIDPAVIINRKLISYQNGEVEHHHYKLDDLDFFMVMTGRPQVSTGECVNVAKQKFTFDLREKFEEVYTSFLEGLSTKNIDLLIMTIRKNHRLLIELGVVPDKIQSFARAIESLGGAFKICGAGATVGDAAGIGLLVCKQDVAKVCKEYGFEIKQIDLL